MSEIEGPLSPLFNAALHECLYQTPRVIDRLLSSRSPAYLAGDQPFAARETASESILDSCSDKLLRLNEGWSRGNDGVDIYTASPIVTPARLFSMSTTVCSASNFADNPLRLCLARPRPNSDSEGEMELGATPNSALSLKSEVEVDGGFGLRVSTPDADQIIECARGFAGADPGRGGIPKPRDLPCAFSCSSGANLTPIVHRGSTLGKISPNILPRLSRPTKLQPLGVNMSTSTRQTTQELTVGALAAQLRPTPESNMGDFQTPIAPTAQKYGDPKSPMLAAEAHFAAMVNALNKAKTESQAVLASAQHRVQEAEEQKNKAEYQLFSVTEQLALSQDGRAELERRLHKYKSALRDAQAIINKRHGKDSGGNTWELGEAEATITSLTARGHIAGLEDRIVRLENNLQMYRDAYGQAEWNIQTLEGELEAAYRRVTVAEEEVKVTEQLLKRTEEELGNLRIKYVKLEDKASNAQRLAYQVAKDAEFNRSANETTLAIIQQSAHQVATAAQERGITNDLRSPTMQPNHPMHNIPDWQLQTVVRFLGDVMPERDHSEGHKWLESAAKELLFRLYENYQQTVVEQDARTTFSGSSDLREHQAKEKVTAAEKHGDEMGFAAGLTGSNSSMRITEEKGYSRGFYGDDMASGGERGQEMEDELFYASRTARKKLATRRALRRQQKRGEPSIPEEPWEEFKQQSVKIESPLMPGPLKVRTVQSPWLKDPVNSNELFEESEQASALVRESSELPNELAVHIKKARRSAVIIPGTLSEKMRDTPDGTQGSTIPKQLEMTRSKIHISQSEHVIKSEPGEGLQETSTWAAGVNIPEQHATNIEKASDSTSLLKNPAIPKELAERMARTRTSLVIPHELANKLKKTPSWANDPATVETKPTTAMPHYDKELPVPKHVREDTTPQWNQDPPGSPVKSRVPNWSTMSLRKAVFSKRSTSPTSRDVYRSPKKSHSFGRFSNLSNLSLRSATKSPTKSVFALKNPFRPQRMEPIQESYNGSEPGIALNPENWSSMGMPSLPPPLPPSKPTTRCRTQSSPIRCPTQTRDCRPTMSSPPALGAVVTASYGLSSPFRSIPGSGATPAVAPHDLSYMTQHPPTLIPSIRPARSFTASPTPLPRQFKGRFRSATWLGTGTPPPFESLPLPDGLIRHGDVITWDPARINLWPAKFQRSERG